MTVKQVLTKYSEHGSFTFEITQKLELVCNAPKDSGGVYAVWAKGELIYVGSSGWIAQNGSVFIRKNGMYDRIVRGKQFGCSRRISWPIKMKEDRIMRLRVDSFVTMSEGRRDIPAYVEACCIQIHFSEFKCLPRWNVRF